MNLEHSRHRSPLNFLVHILACVTAYAIKKSSVFLDDLTYYLLILSSRYYARKPDKGLIHHSDRGSQYTTNDFQKLLANVGVIPSMYRAGNCYDNAIAESFFNSLKTEIGNDYIFKTKMEARNAIFEYIEGFYNRVRRHSTLNYCSPTQFEQYLLTRVA